MSHARIAGVTALAVLLSGLSLGLAARADEAKKYPDWNTLWNRGSPPGVWDPSKPKGLGQEAPLKPEYQKIHEQNLAKEKAGINFDIKDTCGPVGMPRLMTAYEPIEIVITPKEVYMLAEAMSPIRRIYTDGRDWPKNPDPSFVGYSIGKWLDTDNDGTYDTLEIETRYMKGPRLMDSTGIPVADDNSTVVKAKALSRREGSGHPARRHHHHRQRVHQAVDGVTLHAAREGSDLRGIQLHRGQPLGHHRRQPVPDR